MREGTKKPQLPSQGLGRLFEKTKRGDEKEKERWEESRGTLVFGKVGNLKTAPRTQ